MLRINCTIIFLLLFRLLLAQNDNLNQKLTIEFKDVLLSEALDQLSEKCALNISYSNQLISDSLKVNASFKNQDVFSILESVIQPFSLEYQQLQKQIVIKKSIPVVKNHTLSGRLKDLESGELLIGANIILNGKTGVVSNGYGFYSITVPSGEYKLSVSFLGYKTVEQQVNLQNNVHLDISMETDNSMIEEIVIHASDINLLRESQSGFHTLKTSNVESMTSHLGESDMIKSLNSLPGIQLYADGSVNFHVRGGNYDQNMILVDDAQVYNPSHLFGFYSSFIPEAVNNLKVYKTDIPANYSGKLSSLIDIKIKEGNKNHFSFGGSLGLVTNRLTLEGPIVRNKASYFITTRNSHIDWLAKNEVNRIKDFNFSDLYTKLSVDINKNNRLYASLYLGGDNFLVYLPDSSDASGIAWQNSLLNIRLNHNYSDRLFSNTTVVASEYKYYYHTSVNRELYWLSSISNAAIKHDLSYYYSPEFKLETGLSLGFNSFDPGNYYLKDSLLGGNAPVVPKHFTTDLSVYLSAKHNVSSKLSMRYGVALSVWNNIGEAIIYDYNQDNDSVNTTIIPSGKFYNSFVNLEPRFSLNYRLNERRSLKFSYTNTVQYIQLLSNSVSPFTSFQVYLPANKNIKPQKAHNISAGYFAKLGKKDYLFSAELFARYLQNQIDYKHHATLFLNPYIENELYYGNTYVYGVELQVSKEFGKLAGFVNYTFSGVKRKTEGISEDDIYPAIYEKPHDLNIQLNYKLNPRWLFGANWLLHSGARFSSPTGFMYYKDYQVPIFTLKNNDRFFAYHRLDLSVTYNLCKSDCKFKHQLKFSLYNAYARKNPISINFNKANYGNGQIIVPSNRMEQPLLIVTKTYVVNFFPSLTYTIKFR